MGKKAHAVVARRFGQVHGRFGLAQQLGRVLTVIGDHDHPGTSGQVQGLLVNLQGLGDLGQHVFDAAGRLGAGLFQCAAQVGQQQGKGVAVDAGKKLVLHLLAAQALGQGAQGGIAKSHAKGIVDGFEIIKIKGRQGRSAVRIALYFLKLQVNVVKNLAAVGQAGQGIKVGQLPDFGLGLQARAHIAGNHRAHGASVHLALHGGDFARDGGAIHRQKTHIPHARGPSGGPLADEGAVFRAHQGEDIGPNELLGGPPQQLFGPAIDVQDGALFVKKDRLQGGIGQLVKPCLGRAQCRLAGVQRLGHVLQGLAQLKQLAGARQGRSDL